MELERFIKTISKSLALVLIFLISSYLYLETKGHVYSKGFDIIGRIGGRSSGVKEDGSFSLVMSAFANEVSKEAATESNKNYSEEVQKLAKDHFMGDKDAKVVIYDFSSLDCSACARFHEQILPEIVKNYVDTGKVKLVFADFPISGIAMGASMLARCLPEKSYFSFVDLLMKNQGKWLRSDNAKEALANYARLAGLNSAAIDSCFNNKDLAALLMKKRKENGEEYKITATPTLVIKDNDGKQETIVGVRPYEEIEKIIAKFLK